MICDMCSKEMERRVMSPFMSFKATSFDWVAEVRVPVVEKDVFQNKKMTICPECYRKISDVIKNLQPKKIRSLYE